LLAAWRFSYPDAFDGTLFPLPLAPLLLMMSCHPTIHFLHLTHHHHHHICHHGGVGQRINLLNHFDNRSGDRCPLLFLLDEFFVLAAFASDSALAIALRTLFNIGGVLSAAFSRALRTLCFGEGNVGDANKLSASRAFTRV
jgi:hypothetical protein